MDIFMPIVTAIVSFAITAILGYWFVPMLRKMKFGQTILEIGPKWHESKNGTPTMGGIMFVIGVVASLVLCVTISGFVMDANTFSSLAAAIKAPASQNGIRTTSVFIGLMMALASGFIGFIDDYVKVVKKRNLGLTARQKTLLQLLVSAVYLLSLYLSGYTFIFIPFAGQIDVAHGWGLIFWPIALVFVYGFMNAVNLTDGIDGLCSSVTMMGSIFYMLYSTAFGYLGLNFLSCAMVGGCGGFLVWNLKPAKVFMGDTGSLFLGGAVVAMAFASGYPILLLLIGIVYLMEALSVVIQVSYYKKTKKRIFKMAPIHHHFEMSGWSENKIVVVFSSITLLGAIISAALLLASKLL